MHHSNRRAPVSDLMRLLHTGEAPSIPTMRSHAQKSQHAYSEYAVTIPHTRTALKCSQRNHYPKGNHSLRPQMRCPTRQPKRTAEGAFSRVPLANRHRSRIRRVSTIGAHSERDTTTSQPRQSRCLCAERMEET